MLLCGIGIGAWAETVVTDPATEMVDGTYITLQCMDTNGGDEYYFKGNAQKSETRSFDNIYKIVSNGADAFYLQRVSDNKYVGKSGDAVTMESATATAAAFTFSIATATGWSTYNSEKYTNGTSTVRFTTSGTYLNTQAKAGTPKYAGGTGGYSIWYVKTYTQTEVDALNPNPHVFDFTSWTYNSFERIGGTEGTATLSLNMPMFLTQKGVQVTTEGDLTVTFTYTDGWKRLEIYGVDLIDESTGNVAYSSYSHKFAGGNRQGQVYTLSNVAPGTYTIRYWSSKYGDGGSMVIGDSSIGTIVHSGDAATGIDFTNTTWNCSTNANDWKNGTNIPADVINLVNAETYHTLNNIHQHVESNLTFAKATTYNIHFNYTGAAGGGNEQLNLRGVDVVDASGNVVACDYHDGYTGHAASERDYKISIPAGTYSLRVLVQSPNANDVRSNGDITYTSLDASAVIAEYTTWKEALYDNGTLRIGAPSASVLGAIDALIDAEADGSEIEAAFNAAKTTNNLNLPDGYYYMKNMDAGNLGYAYNDYNHEGNTSHKTLMTATTGTNNTIWKVTNNGATIDIVNGDGKGISHTTLYNNLHFGNFNNSQFVSWGNKGIYFTEGLHASNQSHLKLADGTLFLTPWAHSDSRGSTWDFIPVEDANIYTVAINGAPEGSVSLGGQYAFDGGFFNAASITKEDLQAASIDGYNTNIDVTGNAITVTYTYKANHPYLVYKCERGGIIANSSNALATGTYDDTADNQKFLVVNIEGNDYLYSKSAQKFVTSPASGTQFILVDYPHHVYTTTAATSPNGDYNTILKINNATMNNNNAGSMVNGWESQDAGNKFQINEVGGISDEEYDALVASIKAACDAKKASMTTQNESYGTAYGQYSWTNKAATDEAVAAANALDTEADDYYTSLFAEIRKFDIAYAPTLNTPQPGSYLRIKGYSNKYVSLPTKETNGAMSEEEDKTTIMYYSENREIISFATGLGLSNTSIANNTGLNTFTFSQGAQSGKYNVVSNATGMGTYLYDNNATGTKVDRNTTPVTSGSYQTDWTLIAVSDEEIKTLSASTANTNGFTYGVAPEISEGVYAPNIIEKTADGYEVKNLVLTDKQSLVAPVEFTAVEATYSRNLADDGGWNTAFLPFPFTVTAEMTVLHAGSINGSNLTLEQYETGAIVAAGTPVVYKAPAGLLTVTAVNAIITPKTDFGNDGSVMYGTYQALPAGYAANFDAYIMNSAGTAFAKASDLAPVPAFRAFMIPPTAGSNVYTITIGDDLTGIFSAGGNINQKVDVYSLDGKVIRTQVDAITALQGLASGTYIVNGQKIKK